jgi:hypothetical protein
MKQGNDTLRPGLPVAVAAYVRASNGADLGALLNVFVDDALVNDQLCDYWGKDAIAEWAASEIIAQGLTMSVTKVVNRYDNVILTAQVRGDFDMRGLPDPLLLGFYFSISGDRIVQLIILRNRTDV